MKSHTTLASTMLVVYPEKNPFDIDPPVVNLTPFARDDECNYDLPEFIAAARAQAKRNAGLNPLYMWYGNNPLVVHEEHLFYDELPLTSYEQPPPLLKVTLEEPIEFLEQLHPQGDSYIYKVRVAEDVRLLKVYPDKDRDEEDDPNLTGLTILRFRREAEAYAHLLHGGVDKMGVVPRCYGWFDLKEEDVDHISALPLLDLNKRLQPLTVTRRPPKGILLEYLPDATVLTIANITMKIADTALRALYHIHAAYVKHGDIDQRNILLLPGGRIVWVNFDSAICASKRNKRYKINRKDLFDELAEGWGLFYTSMLPNKRITYPVWSR